MTILEICVIVIALALLPAALNTLAELLGFAFGLIKIIWLLFGLAMIIASFLFFTRIFYMISEGSTSIIVSIWVIVFALIVLYAKYAAASQAAYNRMSFLALLYLWLGAAFLVNGLYCVFYVVGHLDTLSSDVGGVIAVGLLSLGASVLLLVLGVARVQRPTGVMAAKGPIVGTQAVDGTREMGL